MQDEFGLSPCTVPMQAIVFTRPVLLTEPASPSIGVASIFRRIVRYKIPMSNRLGSFGAEGRLLDDLQQICGHSVPQRGLPPRPPLQICRRKTDEHNNWRLPLWPSSLYPDRRANP
jgi:hypothetical protein